MLQLVWLAMQPTTVLKVSPCWTVKKLLVPLTKPPGPSFGIITIAGSFSLVEISTPGLFWRMTEPAVRLSCGQVIGPLPDTQEKLHMTSTPLISVLTCLLTVMATQNGSLACAPMPKMTPLD